MKKFLILAIVFLTSLSGFATQIPNSSIQFLNQCLTSPDCDLMLFSEIAKTYRPSGEETELANYVIAIKSISEQEIWKKPLEETRDKFGNILIRLPATGKYVGLNSNYFSLQSHMDMVLAYSEAKPGEDIKPYFRNGIQLEIKDGWLQSVGNKTTLGADNGIGVAYALHYLIDPRLEHPPLELIFTVQEETGLIGAFNSELPILSKKMLCLDGMTPEPGYIIVGAQGGIGNEVKATTQKMLTVNSSETVTVQISVTQLAGGHSGGDIFRNRLNAIKAFGGLVKFVASKVGEVSVKTLVAGNVPVLNQIPNLFQAELVIPKAKVSTDLKYQIETYLKSLLVNPDDAAKAKIEIFINTENQPTVLTNQYDFTNFLVATIEQAPNGVLETDPKYYNNVYTSSNLSFMKIAPTPTGSSEFYMGYLTRGFNAEHITGFADQIKNLFTVSNAIAAPVVTNKMSMPPWIEPDSSELMNETLTLSGVFSKKFYLTAGLEPSAFKAKIKDLQVIALGPYNQMAHSVNEKLKVDTIASTFVGIQKIITNQK